MSPGTNTTTIQLTQLFDHLDGAVYIADMATYEVLYINPFLRQLFGDVEGSLCWESLQSGRQEGPCEFCTNSRLLDSAGRPVTIAHWESTETLDGRGYSLQDQAIEWPDGRMVKLVVATDISARLRSEKALRFLAESSPQPDPDPFFQQALSQLAECCGARWAFVARLTGEGQKAVRTLTFHDRGHFSPPVTWLLNGSPCERLGPGKVNLIDAGVRERFPSDLLLQTLAVESHFCTALMAGDRALGVLVVMNDGPMVILSNTAFILRSFAVRMAAEIQRMESSAESRSGSIATRDHADLELNFATSVFHNSLPSNPHALSRIGEISKLIIDTLATPYRVEKHQVSLSASIGIALYPKDAGSRDDLILYADRAMYHAKKSGRSTFKFYSKQIDLQARRRLALEKRLGAALSRGEFRIHYQPQIDLESRQVSGLEALVRWQYESEQLLYPGEFISVAEQTGQMVALGEWVLRTACNQLFQWHQLGFDGLSIIINLSPQQLMQNEFPARVAAILEETGISSTQLEFDTRERFLLQPGSEAFRVLSQLKKMGIRIALDDFGSGYSSLIQLRNSPLDIIKMDPSFIDRIEQKPDTLHLAAAIISLAHGLKLKIVAEGVENRAQLEFLSRHRCDGAQGLMLGEPLPAEQTSCLLQSGWQPLS